MCRKLQNPGQSFKTDDYRNRNMKHKQLKALVIGTTSWDTIIDIENFLKKQAPTLPVPVVMY